MIDKDKIEVRKTTINSDIQAVKQRLLEYQEKIKEDTALINALTGAKQVTQDLLDGYIIDVSQESIDKDLSTVSKNCLLYTSDAADE